MQSNIVDSVVLAHSVLLPCQTFPHFTVNSYVWVRSFRRACLRQCRCVMSFSLTGARVQSQSEQIWMYNRYEIVMEYAKRPRLPPPFVVISYIGNVSSEPCCTSISIFFSRSMLGMVISYASRQCVLKLKEVSDKKNSANHRPRAQSNVSALGGFHGEVVASNSPNSNAPLVVATTAISSSALNDTPDEVAEDRSLLGRLLNCKPCRQVTDNQKEKLVCLFISSVDCRTPCYSF